MQRVGGVRCLAMFWPDIDFADHYQSAGIDPRHHLYARAQAEMFGKIGQDQPSFAVGFQMLCQSAEKGAQHAAVRIVDCGLDRGTGACRQPRRSAYHQRGASGGKHVCLQQFHLAIQTEPFDILSRASERAAVLIGDDHMCNTPLYKYSGEHADTGPDVEGARLRWQRRLRNQIDVFAAHRRKHAVVRMNARLQRRNLDPFLRHSCAPIKPSTSRSDTTDASPFAPYTSSQARRMSGARRRGTRYSASSGNRTIASVR